MCAVFAVIAYGLMKLTLKLSALAARKKILSYGRPSEQAASALLCSYFGTASVLSGIWLPCLDERGKKMYTEVDDIIVLGSCIVSVEIKSLVGKIYSDDERTWHQSAVTRSGEKKELDFTNPVLQNSRHIEAIKAALKKENISPPEIYNAVIFTSEKVVFTVEQPNVFRLGDGVEYIKSLSKEKTMSTQKRLSIIRAIRKNSAKPFQARAYNDKKRLS